MTLNLRVNHEVAGFIHLIFNQEIFYADFASKGVHYILWGQLSNQLDEDVAYLK